MTTTTPTRRPRPRPPAAIRPPPSANSDEDATLTVAETALGDTLVDATGKTLYVFDNDAADTSACTGQCEAVWPPLTVTGDVVVGGGLDEEDFATFAREGGAMQVTAYGLPLYTFSGDTAAGETNGQGVGGIWWAVGADGRKIDAASAGSSSSSTEATADSTGGY